LFLTPRLVYRAAAMARNPKTPLNPSALPIRPARRAGVIGGVVLAGGLSRRMGGGDKCLLPLAGTPILALVIARLRPQVDRLVLNANGDPSRFARFGAPVVADSVPDFAGPLAGVLAGMDWAANEGIDLIATAAADTPFFPETLVAGLVAAMAREAAPLAVAMTEDAERGSAPHPTFGLWTVGLREDLRAAIGGGVRRVVDWTASHGCAKAVFAGEAPFFNVNAPVDLARAEAMLAERAR
jgi:molybdenum cofactor guanylyltransferase